MIFHGKRILVTGGTGSFGRHITNQLLKTGAEEIRIFSRDEEKQLDMQREITDERITYYIGDIRDADRINRVMEGIDLVYHAAALKIITTAELNPDDAIKTNIQGTQNVKNACIQNEVTSAVLISTDKAVKPVNLYGMTKAIAEKIWVATRPKPSCNFSVVRYGNVVGSRGSIVPFFKQLVTENKPIPITHADMTRFLITLDQAIELVFNATGSDGIIHVPIIPAAKVTDLVEAIAGPAYPTIKIGIRPGEKIHECLINEYEILITKQRGLSYLIGVKDPDHCLSDEFTSLTARKLSVEEVRGFL